MVDMVVVGAGQAGFSVVENLRKGGFDGKITMIGAEEFAPYQRPPLSKGYLLGDMARERLFFRPESFYVEHEIELVTCTKVVGVDAGAHSIALQNGTVIGYDKLALTTGASPRRLPSVIGGDLGGVHVVRSLADIDDMAHRFRKGARLLIVGGGYIGLEAAAVAAKLGLRVTLVEMSERILQRVAARETSGYFRALHVEHGVDLREGIGLERLDGKTEVKAAVLSDGTELAVDFVIVGVGVTPDTELAEMAGLMLDNGIAVDAQCRTSDVDIFAAGDCASIELNGARVRIESVGNAIDMGQIAAAAMLGGDAAYAPKPWFWSDQYDVKLQIAGLNTGYDHVVTRGEGREVSHWYYRGETLLAVDAMNDPRAYMIGKRLIEAGKSPAPSVIASADNLMPLLKA